MTMRTGLKIAHGLLFAGFSLAATWAVVAWFATGDLEGTVFGATIAAFFATASSFVERIFPLDER